MGNQGTIITPEGAAPTDLALTATGAQALTIANQFTIVDGVTVEATGNRTINLTINSEVRKGATLFIKTKANGTESTIFGTLITSVTVVGAAAKTNCQSFTYDGSVFLPDGLTVLID